MSGLPQRPPGFVYRTPETKHLQRSSARLQSAGNFVPRLYCQAIPISSLAEKFGTPLYIYSAAAIRERVQSFRTAFREIDHTICYSVKANSNLSLLRFLAKLRCGFDVVSGGELERVLRAAPGSVKQVVFSGVGKASAELDAALKAGILLFNVESASELETLARCAARLRRTAQIAFRVNPDVPANTHPYISTGLQKHKFGVPLADARSLYSQAAKTKFLKVAGVSVHIGSQITDSAPFSATMHRVAELVQQLRADGHKIRFVDAGGGLGIDYSGQANSFRACVEKYASAIIKPLKNLDIRLLLEPGRSIIASAGVLLTRIVYRKANGNKNFVIVDAAMNDLIRPSLYQAEHQIVPVECNDTSQEVVDIVGPICESGDFFARDRELPKVAEGDLLAVLDAGAYGMALASNYNTRSRAAEVLVSGSTAKVIRKRETISDLLRNEIGAL